MSSAPVYIWGMKLNQIRPERKAITFAETDRAWEIIAAASPAMIAHMNYIILTYARLLDELPAEKRTRIQGWVPGGAIIERTRVISLATARRHLGDLVELGILQRMDAKTGHRLYKWGPNA